jgi:putative hydrolase of the HAD superfamily
MINVYLFDCIDTLMVDFPSVKGKMCNWEIVEAVTGGEETFEELSKQSEIYIVTGAADSTELEIQQAFKRVGLSKYISGYFCQANLGLSKGSSEFFESILDKLKEPSSSLAMVGDNLVKDIKPAIASGIQPFCFTDKSIESVPDNVKLIRQLSSLHI